MMEIVPGGKIPPDLSRGFVRRALLPPPVINYQTTQDILTLGVLGNTALQVSAYTNPFTEGEPPDYISNGRYRLYQSSNCQSKVVFDNLHAGQYGLVLTDIQLYGGHLDPGNIQI